jgi:hypothetical protein
MKIGLSHPASLPSGNQSTNSPHTHSFSSTNRPSQPYCFQHLHHPFVSVDSNQLISPLFATLTEFAPVTTFRINSYENNRGGGCHTSYVNLSSRRRWAAIPPARQLVILTVPSLLDILYELRPVMPLRQRSLTPCYHRLRFTKAPALCTRRERNRGSLPRRSS